LAEAYLFNKALALPPWASACFNDTAVRGLSSAPHSSLNKSLISSILSSSVKLTGPN